MIRPNTLISWTVLGVLSFHPAIADENAVTRNNGGDMTFCELFGLRQFGRVGDVVGLAVATTSLNIGDEDLQWFIAPDPEHPFIVMNLYRLKDDRFEQIGQSWVKHGFAALNNDQCSIGCQDLEPGHLAFKWLGVGCTDTYSAGLNANPDGLGPRYEVNPWTGDWSFTGSHFDPIEQNHDAISHRLQVHDNDLDPDMNPGADYYVESYYVMLDDIDVMNSAGWKKVTPIGTPGGTWTFNMTLRSDPPNIGFAIDAWAGATQTTFAQEVPPVEFSSPDGRCVLAGKATDLNDGYWRYEYALLNIDMDRQVGSFCVPVPCGANVRDMGFHAVPHHDESMNAPGGVPIDNSDWNESITPMLSLSNDETYNLVCWSTTTNPLRWGTLYNFHFETNAPPVTDADLTIGHFKAGTPTHLAAEALGPAFIPLDADNDGVCDTDDICPGFDDAMDSDGDGRPDGCDVCPQDDPDDSDNDGVCDSDDACAGFDDNADADGDGRPDDCDACPQDNPDDTDGDGVCDVDDVCAGADDNVDSDGDGVADGCDACPLDNPNDTDGDGVCDSDDVCPGFDDGIDTNGNGVPDDCEEPAPNPLNFLLFLLFGPCAPMSVATMSLTLFGITCMKMRCRRPRRE